MRSRCRGISGEVRITPTRGTSSELPSIFDLHLPNLSSGEMSVGPKMAIECAFVGNYGELHATVLVDVPHRGKSRSCHCRMSLDREHGKEKHSLRRKKYHEQHEQQSLQARPPSLEGRWSELTEMYPSLQMRWRGSKCNTTSHDTQ